MTAERCVGEPVSWLRLERYHLGEIAGAEREAIAAHLAACPACAACLASIEQDDGSVLPTLAVTKAPPRAVLTRLPVRAAAVVGALAAAAALVLVMRGSSPTGDGHPARVPGGRIKGDAIAFSLVRDDGERIVGADGVYRDGDRFKAIVTCAPGSSASFDLAVFDSGDPTFPLAPAHDFACGNGVPLPGAFRLTGASDETVCIVWSETGAVDRSALAGAMPSGNTALCKRLRAAP
jgi:hypothetical protein